MSPVRLQARSVFPVRRWFRSGPCLVAACACLLWLAGAGRAMAQTVILRNAVPGAAVDVSLIDRVVARGTADANGAATLTIPAAAFGREAMDALVFVESCEGRHRVILIGRADRLPAPEAGCVRREISGVFFVQPISTLVVTLGEAGPTLLLRQGPFDPDRPPRVWTGPPTGLIAFGGTGVTTMDTARVAACGNVADCAADGSGFALTGGIQFWFRPFLGAEIAYVQPARTTAEGSGPGYGFASTFEPRVLTVGGLVGIPAGPVRIQGFGGATYYQASFITEQTIEPVTLTIDGTPVVVAGGTQTLASRTGGWRWAVGAGLDVWFSPRVGVYGDLRWLRLQGEDLDAGEASFEDTAIALLVGVRVRLGF